MIKPEQIPDEAIEAAARAFACKEDGDDFVWDAYIPYAEYAISAAINAWPGLLKEGDLLPQDVDPLVEIRVADAIVLPVKQERNDD